MSKLEQLPFSQLEIAQHFALEPGGYIFTKNGHHTARRHYSMTQVDFLDNMDQLVYPIDEQDTIYKDKWVVSDAL